MKILPIIAILCITILEIVALCQEINGAIFGIAIAAIAVVGGDEMHKIRISKGGK